MKKNIILIASLFILISSIFADNPKVFKDYLKKIEIQSSEFKGSSEHDAYKSQRDSRDYQVGDQNIFWSWALNVMPPDWILTPATCRAVGDHCYLFVADDEWEIHMDQNDVDEIMPYLEDYTMNSTEYGAFEMDIVNFGPIPDELDNDPKVIILYMELGSYAGSIFDGYFSSFNQITEAEAQSLNPPAHSNECEMIYMTCFPLQPDDPIRISVLSHELQHLIHWGADVNESTWVNEGCSELAMVLFGLPDPITSFPTNPDNSLIVWDQSFADYVKTMLFFTYLYEYFGYDGLIADVVSDPANSITGIQNQLIEHGYMIPFDAIFANWTLANYLDDPNAGAGQYNYDLLDLPQFTHSAYISTFPDEGTGNVNPWAAEYLKLTTDDVELGSTLAVTIDPNHSFSFAVLFYEDNTTLSHLETIPANEEFTIELMGTEDEYYKIILVVSNNTSTSLSYSYSLEIEEVNAVEEEAQEEIASITAYPNPVSPDNSSVTFFTENIDISDRIELFNIKGQKIRDLSFSSEEMKTWDLNDKYDRPVTNGIYLYRLKNSGNNSMKKLLILR